jgi:hypothetical protein
LPWTDTPAFVVGVRQPKNYFKRHILVKYFVQPRPIRDARAYDPVNNATARATRRARQPKIQPAADFYNAAHKKARV